MTVSIITINYNNNLGLIKTISSVIAQTFKNFEFIVIDGGSNDGSVETIKENSDIIDYWVSEKDKGIYHAMNKGVAQASGDFLLMLNSGDSLASFDTLSDVFKDKEYSDSILYGNIRWESKDTVFKDSIFPDSLNFKYFWLNSIGHQAAFIKRSAHDIVGFYNKNPKNLFRLEIFILA